MPYHRLEGQRGGSSPSTAPCLLDGTRDFHSNIVRCYIIPEFISSAMVQMIVGIRPDQGCSNAPFGVVLISAAMLGYLLVVRPYRTRLDMFFSILLNTLQVAVSIFSIIAVHSQARSDDHYALRAVSIVMYGLLMSYFVQVFVQPYWSFHCHQRRRHHQLNLQLEEALTTGSSNDQHDSSNSLPSSTPTAPLQQKQRHRSHNPEMASLHVPMLNPLSDDCPEEAA